MELKLKPCPFCGSSASPAWNELSAYTWVECDNPDCDTVMRGPNAFERWNKRHSEPPAVDEVPPLDNQRRESSADLFIKIYNRTHGID